MPHIPLPPLTQIPSHIVAVDDYAPFARERMTAGAWAYMAGGAADELTLCWNRAAYERVQLQGRVLADLRGGNTRVQLFGDTLDYPILLAPIAYHKLAHPDGELATALGASAIGAGWVVSTKSSVSLEEIAQASHTAQATRTAKTPLWFQLYLQPDRALNLELIRRAENAGYRALVVTVDAPVSGVRNVEQRAGFHLPSSIKAVNLRDQDTQMSAQVTPGVSTLFDTLLAQAPTWDDLAWVRAQTRLPVLVKGITAPADAQHALHAGVDGIIVSNHGGRTLDTLPATLDILPRIADVVEGRVPLLMDGGIRRGTDVLKALALGAQAVLVGRPYIFGLATAGASGVAHVMHLLRTELEVAMALSGCRDLAAVTREVLWRKTND